MVNLASVLPERATTVLHLIHGKGAEFFPRPPHLTLTIVVLLALGMTAGSSAENDPLKKPGPVTLEYAVRP